MILKQMEKTQKSHLSEVSNKSRRDLGKRVNSSEQQTENN